MCVTESVRGTGQKESDTKTDMRTDKRGARFVTCSFGGMEDIAHAVNHALEQDPETITTKTSCWIYEESRGYECL